MNQGLVSNCTSSTGSTRIALSKLQLTRNTLWHNILLAGRDLLPLLLIVLHLEHKQSIWPLTFTNLYWKFLSSREPNSYQKVRFPIKFCCPDDSTLAHHPLDLLVLETSHRSVSQLNKRSASQTLVLSPASIITSTAPLTFTASEVLHTSYSPNGKNSAVFRANAGKENEKERTIEIWDVINGVKLDEIEVGKEHGDWYFDGELLYYNSIKVLQLTNPLAS